MGEASFASNIRIWRRLSRFVIGAIKKSLCKRKSPIKTFDNSQPNSWSPGSPGSACLSAPKALDPTQKPKIRVFMSFKLSDLPFYEFYCLFFECKNSNGIHRNIFTKIRFFII
ncbi:unnamed protein product [Arabidopsis halleri]